MKEKIKSIVSKCLYLLLFVFISFGTMAFTKPNSGFNETNLATHDHTGWTEVSELPSEAGNYSIYLTADITLSATWIVPVGETNLCLNGHVITYSGMVVKVPTNATLNLYDCNTTKTYYFTKNATTGWSLASDQTIPTDYFVTGGIITGGNSPCGGGINVEGGTLNMYGGNIVGNKAATQNNSDGGGIYLKGTFNMYGGSIVGNYAKHNGGGISMLSTSNNTFNMYGGEIKDNTAAYIGGVNIFGTASMEGGIISGNRTIDSNQGSTGGVCVNGASSTFYMHGGEISNNIAHKLGGGVSVQGYFYMDGGIISGNRTIEDNPNPNDGVSAGGVCVDGKTNVTSVFFLGGSAKITGNTVGAENSTVTNNIHLGTNKTITIGTKTQSSNGNEVLVPTEEMSAGVTLQSGTGTFTTNGTADDVQYFFSDNTNYKILFNSESNFLECYHHHDDIKFSQWADTTSMPNDPGSYILTADITLTSTWTVPFGIQAEPKITNLCLNGHVIKFTGGTGNVINVPKFATLNLYDCGTTSHDGYVDSGGLWHLGEGEGTAQSITGGIITGGNNTASPGNGGGVLVDKGNFYMYGGNIVGNYAKSGAGVHVAAISTESALFNMSGGTISHNKATSAGGGVYATKSINFIMTGGEISSNNVDTVNGGGVFTLSDITLGGTAKITDNTANSATNNLHLHNDPKITLNNPTTTGDNKMQIGVTLSSKTGVFSSNGTVNDTKYFISDVDYTVCFNEDHNYLELKYSIKDVAFNDIDQPVATKTAPQAVSGIATGARYTGEIEWSPSLVNDKFAYNTTYTATITLTITPSNKDHAFADNVNLFKPTQGWTKSNESTTSKLIYTKTFEKTGVDPNNTSHIVIPLDSYTYTVIFDADNGTTTKQSVLMGSKLTSPEMPSKEGYIFEGWYNDEDKWDFDSNKVTKNITLTAKYVLNHYDVTFIYDNELENLVITCNYGEKIAKPINPIKSGYVFEGWFNKDIKWDFDTLVTSELTLTAHYSKCNEHSLVKVPSKPATCNESGYKEAYYCSKCNIYFADLLGSNEIGDLTSYNLWKNNEGKLIAGHKVHKIVGVIPTLNNSGYKEAYKCDECNKYFEDENCTKLIGDEIAYTTWKTNDGYLPKLEDKKLTPMAIVGICLGSIVLLLIILYLLGYFLLYRKGKLDDKKIKVIYKMLPSGNNQ